MLLAIISVVAGLTTLAQGPAMWAIKCTPGDPAQQWGFARTPNKLTNVQLAGNVPGIVGRKGWQIEGCFTKQGAKVGVDGCCKPLPPGGKCSAGPRPGVGDCACNEAFTFKPGGSIVAAMDGQCLQVNHNSGGIVGMSVCTGGADQNFSVLPGVDGASLIVSEGLCVTACGGRPCGPPPPPPPPGSCPTFLNRTACPPPPKCQWSNGACVPPPPPAPCASIASKANCTASPRHCTWNGGSKRCSVPPPPPAPPYNGLNYTCDGPWEAGHCYAPCDNPRYSSLPYCDKSKSLDERIADAVSRLSLGEKISNMMASASNGWSEHGGFPSIGLPQQTTSEALHGVMEGCLPLRAYPNASSFHSPAEAAFALNGGSGCATSFPVGITLGATFNRSLWRSIGHAIGTEGRAYHNLRQGAGVIYWTPDVNLIRDPRWGRSQEVPGEDPFLTGQYAYSFITGMQGDGEYRLGGAGPKHFGVYDVEACRHGHSINGVDCGNATVSQKDLVEFYWPVWQQVAKANATSVMCSYNMVNGVPSCANGHFQNDLLRGTWGYDGVIVSDCGAIQEEAGVMNHNYTDGNITLAVALSIKAGTDTDCGHEEYRDQIKSALDEGLLTESDLDTAVSRILKASFRLGEFEGNRTVPAQLLGAESVDTQASRALALEGAKQAMTLLRNQGDLLPLDKLANMAFIGPLADATQGLLSTYQGANTLVNNHSALQAAAAMGLHVTFERGHSTNINDPNRSFVPAAVTAAKAADVAIMFIGLSTLGKACEGEEHDRGSTGLPGAQEPLLKAVLRVQPRTVVVLIGGGSLSVEAARHCQQCAVLYAYYPGELGGDAIISTIVGNNNPSGRLPYTLYPLSMTTHRKINDYDLRSFDGLTYKWYTGKLSGPALWEFGAGFTFTNFTFAWRKQEQAISVQTLHTTEAPVELSWKVVVSNTGKRAGAVAALAFVEGGDGVETPLRSLVGFEKLFLGPGQSRTVTILTTVGAAFSVVEASGQRVMRADERTIAIGEHGNSARRDVHIVGPDVTLDDSYAT